MKKGIVMGASSGIGREVALKMLNDGWTLGIAARRKEPLEEIAQRYPGQVVTATIDVCEDNASEKLLQLIERLDGIDLYFHASGIGKQNPSLNLPIELETVGTNCIGFTRMIDTAFNQMSENGGGQIAAITSIAGTKGLGPAPSYSATKSFQSTYLQALDQLSHSRKLNISITDIRPGFVDTPLLNDAHKYPMMMDASMVAEEIANALSKKKRVRVIDWRYRMLTALWRAIPNALWRRIKLVK